MNTNEPKTQLEKALGEPITREKAQQLIRENLKAYCPVSWSKRCVSWLFFRERALR